MWGSHTEMIRELFAREVPEVSTGLVEIRAIAREVGYLSKVVVASLDRDIDPVAICVGDRGARIRRIVTALDGERLDLIRWSDQVERLLRSALQPADLTAVVLDATQRKATIFVEKDQYPLLLGQDGLNQRLTEELIGHEIVVETL
jgi:transcription termination/antitermination protein NusA